MSSMFLLLPIFGSNVLHQWIMFAKLLYLILVLFRYNSLIIINHVGISVCTNDVPLPEVNFFHVRNITDWTQVFKMFRGLSVVDSDTFFELDKSSRTRGHILKLKKSCVVTDLRQHFFTERVINIWNHLESSVVEAKTINTFKSRLQKIYDTDESFFGRYTSQ